MTIGRRTPSFWLLPVTALLLIGVGFGARVLLIRLAEQSIAEHQREILAETACVVHQAPGPMTPHPWGDDNLWDLLHPALDALQKLKPAYEELDPDYDELAGLKNLDGIGAVLLQGKADLEACRKALERPNREWRGERDPNIISKAEQAGLFLSRKAYLDWKQGLDADAMNGVLVALEISQLVCRLELARTRAQQEFFELGAYDLMISIEGCAWDAARHILSGHRLSSRQLEDVERRLDALRANRPSPTPLLVNWGARTRRDALDPGFSVLVRDGAGVASQRTLRENLGLRDLYAEQVRVSRVLGRIRRGAMNAQRLDWNNSAEIEPLWAARCLGYTGDEQDQLWTLSPGFETVYRALLRWDLLRVAIAVARYEAANNRMPLTLDEAKVGEVLARPVAFQGDSFTASVYPPGMTSGRNPVDSRNWTFTIRRR